METYFAKVPFEDYVDSAAKNVWRFISPAPGDISVFMTGQEDINCVYDRTIQMVADLSRTEENSLHFTFYLFRTSCGSARIS